MLTAGLLANSRTSLGIVRLRSFVFVLIVSCLAPSLDAMSVKRDIVVPYFGQEIAEISEHPIHRFIELPLNHLGYVVTYWDIDKGFPSDAEMEKFYAIVTWFMDRRFSNPLIYADWLKKNIVLGKKYIFFNHTNLEENDRHETTQIEKVNEVLGLLGLQRQDEWVNKIDITRFESKNTELTQFERKFLPEKTGFYAQKAVSADVDVWLSCQYNGGRQGDLVFISPAGGGAQEGHFFYTSDIDARGHQWLINPIVFLRKALNQSFPIPDLTTVFGRRTAFVHIDGDGWNNLSEIVKNVTSAEIIVDQFVTKRSYLPVTLGPIAADFDPEWGGISGAHKVLLKAALLPNVQIASHSYSHPQHWSYFKDNPSLDREKKEKEKKRDVQTKAFDLEIEVKGSVDFLSRFLPKEKPINLYLWSGDCLPYAQVFEKLSTLKLLNLNGSFNRFDVEYPSMAGISPFYRRVGDFVQVYAAGANEESYTSGWSERFFGLKYFVETLKNTEIPYRLKPIHLYFNMFTGQKEAALKAVNNLVDYAQEQDVFWLHAYEYAQSVTAYPKVSIDSVGPLHWQIKGTRDLNCFSFETATDLTVDLANSPGVLGYRHYQGSLYVTTDPSLDVIDIKLTAENKITYPYPVARPCLTESSCKIYDLKWDDQHVSFGVKGLEQAIISFQMPLRDSYHVVWQRPDGTQDLGVVKPDAQNQFVLNLVSKGVFGGEVRLMRESGGK